MLLNKLYTITKLDSGPDGSGYTAEIELNPDHPVFRGHFPGNPVLPGVCTVQIIKELLEQALKISLRMSGAGSIKYLGFVNPAASSRLNFHLQLKQAEKGVFPCAATVSNAEHAVCSFKGEFVS